jgi:hypothetical protein
MPLIYLAIGLIVGLFIPSPLDGLIRGWLSALWSKIKAMFNKNTTGGNKSCGCSGC